MNKFIFKNMRKKWRLKIILVIFCLVFLAAAKADIASAAESDNVEGWAWSETIGWISFNCTDTGSCGSSSYGVNIDWATENMSGYAWSENIGWIRFNPNADFAAYPNGFPSEPYNSVKVASTTPHKASGWARACAVFQAGCAGAVKPLAETGGWDGWIKMAKDKGDGGSADYKITITNVTGEFRDYAWGGDVVGWISFNCLDAGGEPLGVCLSSDYKVRVKNNAPEISDVTVSPEDDISDAYCAEDPTYDFSWTFFDADTAIFGDVQTSFQIQVDNNSDFSSPEIDRTILGPDPSYSLLVDDVGYDGAEHYFRIRVFDRRSGVSDWGTGSFTTPRNEYPDSLYRFVPSVPSKLELIQFYDDSIAYDLGDPIVSWSWIFRNIDDSILETSVLQDPDPFFFPETGDMGVELTVVDSSGYTCTLVDDTLFVNIELPSWQEVVPN